MSPIVGVKAYGWDWSTVHGLTMAQAARRMGEQGIDWTLVQNQIDPLPGSAVDQRPPSGAYSDASWVRALQDAGRRVYQSTAVLFSPQEFADHPDMRPIDQHGETFTPFGWYYGLCPTSPIYLERKAEQVAAAVALTKPDGIFLSFLRFPAFWEMWLPGMNRSEIAEYCFCDRCTSLFERSTGVSLPDGGPQVRAGVLTSQLRREWTSWKCGVIEGIASTLRAAALREQPGMDVILNGFGLGGADFGNAVEEVLAQRFANLDAVIDHYELMFYFQIQKRDPMTWIPQRIAEAREQTDRTLLACLQGGAEYLEDIYLPGGRRREITAEEWHSALLGVAESGADGVLTYSWRDLLADEADGGTRVKSLLAYRNGALR